MIMMRVYEYGFNNFTITPLEKALIKKKSREIFHSFNDFWVRIKAKKVEDENFLQITILDVGFFKLI